MKVTGVAWWKVAERAAVSDHDVRLLTYPPSFILKRKVLENFRMPSLFQHRDIDALDCFKV